MPNRKWFFGISFALLAAIIGVPQLVAYGQTLLPAASATVTIIPARQDVRETYTLTGVSGVADLAQDQVHVRFLQAATPVQSRQVNAPTRPDDYAHGTLTLRGTSQDEDLPAGSIFTASNGIQVTTGGEVTVPAGKTVTVPATALQAGVRGNIAPYGLSTSYTWRHQEGGTFDPSSALENPIGFLFCTFLLFLPCLFTPTYYTYDSASVFNATAFVGGKDASVQQRDIDQVTIPLVASLTAQAQTRVLQQVQPGEQLVKPVACTSRITPPLAPHQRSASLSVRVSVSCQGVVVDPRAIQGAAQQLLAQEAHTRLGALYLLEGDIHTTVQHEGVTGTAASFQVEAEGVWAYLLRDGQRMQIARLIAGKPQAESKMLLLEQPGVKQATVQTAGGVGTALPISPQDIKIVVQSPFASHRD
jgi:Baseplate J-like protein